MALTFCLLGPAWHDAALSQEKQVVGWLEKVRISPENLIFRAKLDTGAKHSSLNAQNIKRFEKNGVPWVGFTLTDRNGKQMRIQRPLLRNAKIKLRGKTEKTQDRPVVVLSICLDHIQKEVEVNLANRRNFNYQMLIGRSYLSGDFLVDPGKIFSKPPQCRMVPIP